MAQTQLTGKQIADGASGVNLTVDVTGTLPVGNGGTGLASPGTSGNILTSNGTTWLSSTPSSGGNVVGPASATDNAIVRYDTTTGKLIQDSLAVIDDTGQMGLGTTPTEILHISKTTGNFTTIRYDSGATQGYFFAYDGDNSVNVGSNSNSVVNIRVSNATRATFNASGNLALTSIGATGAVTSSGGGIGYATGAGGTVTQATSKATAVTLSKLSGTITMNAAALAAATTVSFTLTNTFIAATDFVMVQHSSVGTLGAYTFAVTPAAGSASIAVRNVHTASLSEAIVLRFVVIKAVIA